MHIYATSIYSPSPPETSLTDLLVFLLYNTGSMLYIKGVLQKVEIVYSTIIFCITETHYVCIVTNTCFWSLLVFSVLNVQPPLACSVFAEGEMNTLALHFSWLHAFIWTGSWCFSLQSSPTSAANKHWLRIWRTCWLREPLVLNSRCAVSDCLWFIVYLHIFEIISSFVGTLGGICIPVSDLGLIMLF